MLCWKRSSPVAGILSRGAGNVIPGLALSLLVAVEGDTEYSLSFYLGRGEEVFHVSFVPRPLPDTNTSFCHFIKSTLFIVYSSLTQ